MDREPRADMGPHQVGKQRLKRLIWCGSLKKSFLQRPVGWKFTISFNLSQPLPPDVPGSIKGTDFEFEKSGRSRGLV
jgi:hypothetical protein